MIANVNFLDRIVEVPIENQSPKKDSGDCRCKRRATMSLR
jgi:hypothetical protein